MGHTDRELYKLYKQTPAPGSSWDALGVPLLETNGDILYWSIAVISQKAERWSGVLNEIMAVDEEGATVATKQRRCCNLSSVVSATDEGLCWAYSVLQSGLLSLEVGLRQVNELSRVYWWEMMAGIQQYSENPTQTEVNLIKDKSPWEHK